MKKMSAVIAILVLFASLRPNACADDVDDAVSDFQHKRKTKEFMERVRVPAQPDRERTGGDPDYSLNPATLAMLQNLSHDPCQNPSDYISRAAQLFKEAYAYPGPHEVLLYKSKPDLLDVLRKRGDAYKCMGDSDAAESAYSFFNENQNFVSIANQEKPTSPGDLYRAFARFADHVPFSREQSKSFSRTVKTIRVADWGSDLDRHIPEVREAITDLLKSKGYEVLITPPLSGTVDYPCGPFAGDEACLLVSAGGGTYRRSYSYSSPSREAEVGHVETSGGDRVATIYETQPGETRTGSTRWAKAYIGVSLLYGKEERRVYSKSFEKDSLWSLKLGKRVKKILDGIPSRSR